MTRLLREAQDKNVHFVIMRHAEPVAHVSPVRTKRGDSLEQLEKDVAAARKQAKHGKVFSADEVRDVLGL
jgi:hypothetical protein